MNMLKQKLLTKNIRIGLQLLIVTVAVIVIGGMAKANTGDVIRGEIAEIEAQIAANMATLEQYEQEADTLQNKVSALDAEISTANYKISLSEAKIKQLGEELIAAEKELARQKGILANTLVTLYKQGGVSTIELIASSDNYSDYINQEENLERLKASIQESAEEVEAIKNQIEVDKLEQEKLTEEMKLQRVVLNDKRSEQNELLVETQGQEAKYQGIVTELNSQRANAQASLNAYLASLIKENYTSLGFVTTGTIIGSVGSTGFSTGPHIHFAIYDDNAGGFVNPGGYGGLTYGMAWPLPNSSTANITQQFGCVAPPGYYLSSCNGGQNSFHTGLDISGWYGDPVAVAADGDIIFRGDRGDGYGNVVIVDHGDGIYTYYPHLSN